MPALLRKVRLKPEGSRISSQFFTFSRMHRAKAALLLERRTCQVPFTHWPSAVQHQTCTHGPVNTLPPAVQHRMQANSVMTGCKVKLSSANKTSVTDSFDARGQQPQVPGAIVSTPSKCTELIGTTPQNRILRCTSDNSMSPPFDCERYLCFSTLVVQFLSGYAMPCSGKGTTYKNPPPSPVVTPPSIS